VEVMVAIVVTTILLAGARALLSQIADRGSHIAAAAGEADRAANGEALLRTLAGRLHVSGIPGQEVRFAGEPRATHFRTWCEVPAGWLEACEASLGIITTAEGNAFALTLSTGELIPLRRGFRSGEILYLRDAENGGRWMTEWGSSTTAPAALGIVIDGDTSIVRIGERG
jgi:hypothetical protein